MYSMGELPASCCTIQWFDGLLLKEIGIFHVVQFLEDTQRILERSIPCQLPIYTYVPTYG